MCYAKLIIEKSKQEQINNETQLKSKNCNAVPLENLSFSQSKKVVETYLQEFVIAQLSCLPLVTSIVDFYFGKLLTNQRSASTFNSL